MRAGRAGLKDLAPPVDLFADFQRDKAARKKPGGDPGLHAEVFERVQYRDRYLRHIRSSAGSMAALRAIIDEASAGDVYLMCMCPYRTAADACHTYLLLELARELAPALVILPEPQPRRLARGPGSATFDRSRLRDT
jgi:hypothetical protein